MSLEDIIDKNNLPKHIAIIMDGNGRWAKERGAMRIFGHHHGIKAVKDTVEACGELGIPYLTLYTFSTENWNRPKLEVEGIMQLLVKTIKSEVQDLHENNVRLRCIGDISSLPKSARIRLEQAIDLTKNNTGLTLNLALSYSGKWDILQACKTISKKLSSGEIEEENLTEDHFKAHLATEEAPDVDLMIRTGGDHRISNYLLWQLAYAELLFLDDIYWPDFRKENLYHALQVYQTRERRFGKTGEQVKSIN